MNSVKLCWRDLSVNDAAILREFVKSYAEKETLCKHLKLTDEDENIFVETYVDVCSDR